MMTKECKDLDRKILSVLKEACPMQQWGIREGRFILDTGSAEKFYSREEVIAILNRERALLEVKAGRIQFALDLIKLEEQKNET